MRESLLVQVIMKQSVKPLNNACVTRRESSMMRNAELRKNTIWWSKRRWIKSNACSSSKKLTPVFRKSCLRLLKLTLSVVNASVKMFSTSQLLSPKSKLTVVKSREYKFRYFLTVTTKMKVKFYLGTPFLIRFTSRLKSFMKNMMNRTLISTNKLLTRMLMVKSSVGP